MALRDIARVSFVLSSKVGRILQADADAPRDQNSYVGVLPFRQRFDYSYDGALRSIDDSLQRLGLASLDIVYIHDIDAATHGPEQPRQFRAAMQGAYRALSRLREQHVIAGVGLGVNDWQVCLDALREADLDYLLLAGRYTLLDQSALPALLPECERRGVKIILGGPYNSGILATGAQPSDGRRPYFNYAPASGDHRPRGGDRATVPGVRCPAARCGIAVSLWPPHGGQRAARSPQRGRSERESAPGALAHSWRILAGPARAQAARRVRSPARFLGALARRLDAMLRGVPSPPPRTHRSNAPADNRVVLNAWASARLG